LISGLRFVICRLQFVISLMVWIAPSERDEANNVLEKRLWDTADELRANSGLTSQEYSQPMLGLIFLRFADVRFAARRAELEAAATTGRRGSQVDEPAAYHAAGIIYLPASARFDYLLSLPEGGEIGKAVNDPGHD
jgi:type I restriction enzyme M protein